MSDPDDSLEQRLDREAAARQNLGPVSIARPAPQEPAARQFAPVVLPPVPPPANEPGPALQSIRPIPPIPPIPPLRPARPMRPAQPIQPIDPVQAWAQATWAPAVPLGEVPNVTLKRIVDKITAPKQVAPGTKGGWRIS